MNVEFVGRLGMWFGSLIDLCKLWFLSCDACPAVFHLECIGLKVKGGGGGK